MNTRPTLPNATIRLVKVTNSSVSIAWDKATDRETPQSKMRYSVTWCKAPYTWDSRRQCTPRMTDISSYTINQLSPGTTYDIIIYTADEVGCEQMYSKLTVTTQAAATPPPASQNTAPNVLNKQVQVLRLSYNSVTIAWNKSTDRETPQSKMRYSVTWCEAPYTWDSRRQCTPYLTDITSYTINGLNPETVYDIYVYTADERGGEALYNLLRIRTPQKPTAEEVHYPSPANDEERRKQICEGLSQGSFNPKTVLLSDYFSETESDKPAEFLVTSAGLFQSMPVKKVIDNESIYLLGNGVEGTFYPGSILFADRNLAEGTPQKLTNVDLAPRHIYLRSFAGGEVMTTTPVEPSSGNMHRAINGLVNKFLEHPGWEMGSMVSKGTSYHTSKKSMALSFGTNLSFGANKVDFSFSQSSEEQSLLESYDFRQKFFSVALDDEWKQSYDLLFGDKVTWEQIQRATQGRPICIVTSVTYGRDVHYVKEYLSRSWAVKSEQSAEVIGQSFESNQDIAESSVSQKSKYIAIGADRELLLAGVSKDSGESAIDQAIRKATLFAKDNQGNVIAYELELLSGKFASTPIVPTYNGYLWTTEYKRLPHNVSVNVRCNAWTLGSEKNVKVRLDGTVVKYDPSSKRIVQRKYRMLFEERYNGEVESYTESMIELEPNEYIEGYLRLSVRGKASSASKWWQGITALIDPSPGVIYLKINGTTRAGAGRLYLATGTDKGHTLTETVK